MNGDKFLINSFTRPRYIDVDSAIADCVDLNDPSWTAINLTPAGNKAVIEPLRKGQIFRLSNYTGATVVYIRKPITDDIDDFFIEATGTPGIVTTNFSALGTGISIKLPNLGASTVKRIRFLWDGTNKVWRGVQARIG